VVLPVARTAEGPIGLGLIGPRGADEALLDFAVAAMAAIQAGRKH
jgi:Asp-tRNA(Asn)/Glu-tRNA(Gln) amidotransferase A subunit family amidase